MNDGPFSYFENLGRRMSAMPRCEDFPCCGHESGDCPDSSGRMRCVECGKKLKKAATSSICDKCMRAFNRNGHWRGEAENGY